MSSSSETNWIEDFCSRRSNRFLCEVDEVFIEDSFNLTGIRPHVPHYSKALSLILDDADDLDDLTYEQLKKVQKSAEKLYGLVHARFVLTSRGMQRMLEKYDNGDFGRCKNASCKGHPLLPTGLHDTPRISTMKLLCPNCETIGVAEDTGGFPTDLDGAYFGTSWIQMLFLMYPEVRPKKFPTKYEPRVFGFKVHRSAYEDVDRGGSKQTKRRHSGKGEA